MKKNMMDLLKIGVVVPALVLSMAACGNSANSGAGKSAEAPAAEAQEAEAEKEAEATEATDPAETQKEETAAKEAVYENEGVKITVPAEFAEKVIVKVRDKNDDGVLFDVSEKASVEAAKAKGTEYDGVGWLYAICVRNEEEFHRMLCGDMSGEDPIGYDAEGNYYVYIHPTDVRYDRETPEQMTADSDEWSAVVEWANSMKQGFLDENAGLTPFNWSKTDLEAYLARTAYDKDTVYTLSTLEYAQDGALEPNDKVDAQKYFEMMTKDATYETVDVEAPDGEYVVLNFPEDEIRFDFFYAEDGKNLIRQVWGDNERVYRVTFADETKTANDIMDAWAKELAENR